MKSTGECDDIQFTLIDEEGFPIDDDSVYEEVMTYHGDTLYEIWEDNMSFDNDQGYGD